jgi:spore germination protein YaaH
MKHFVSALLIFVVLAALVPDRGLATNQPVGGGDSTHPIVMQQAAESVATARLGPLQPFAAAPRMAAVGGAGNLQREVFGFALASSLSDPTIGYPSWNFSLLSTVAFFGLHVNTDGTFAADSGWNVWNSSQLTGLLSAAHSAGTKVVLTIILQDFSAGTPNMCAGLANRATTVTQTVAEVKGKGVDGVNIDYEGLSGSCANGQTPRSAMTDLAHQLRAALPAGSYLSVDTYASSAGDPAGFFDVPGLSPNVDSFFVMAYDQEYSNWRHAPLNCSSFCLGPTSPLTGYYYNDTTDASQYMAAVPASKVILGLPYYGRKSCVSSAAANQYPSGAVSADGYRDAIGEASAAGVQPGSYVVHHDANDPSGQERWDSWYNTTLACTRELYWDDTVSLGKKYDLVNQDQLRGVGIWNLNFGGGASELWNELASKFGTNSNWISLGGVLTSGVDAASWGPNRLDIFVRGSNNAVWHRGSAVGGWSNWESLGGFATSDPAAVSWGDNRIDLFVRGLDNGLWHRAWNGVWNNWESLGGGLTSGPAVASWAANRLDVFARGANNALYHKAWNGSEWSLWELLGGTITSDPATVSWGPNRIDVFARGASNDLVHKAWGGVAWSAWDSLGGGLTSAPEAASCAVGQLDVFALGGDSAIWQVGYRAGWHPWARVGGIWTADPGAVCRSGRSTIDIFERGQDQAAWESAVVGT